MTVGLSVNDPNHPDLLFTLRWIFLWFLEGGSQTKIDVIPLSISLPTLANTWTLLKGGSLIPWSVSGWAGVAFFHRPMCLCSSCLVPLMCISIHSSQLVCVRVIRPLGGPVSAHKKTQVKPFLNGKLIFLLCPSSVKQLKLWSGGLGRSVAALKSEVSNWLVNNFFDHFCHSVPATWVIH